MKYYEPLNSGESSGVFINLNMQMTFFSGVKSIA